MNPGATLVTSFLVTLVSPATWPLALASFLLRGGIVMLVAPIVVIPSAVGFANVIAPLLTSFVFGGPSVALVLAVLAAAGVGLAWVIIGGLVAAAAEAEGMRIVAADEEVVSATGLAPGVAAASTSTPSLRGSTAWRILAVRLLAHLPTLLALAWGAIRVVALAYRELTVPSDTVTPLILRVARGAPDAIAAILIAWLVGEAIGAIAARRVVLGDDGVPAALGAAIVRLVRHPFRVLILALLPLGALLAVLVPSAAAATTAWDALRGSLASGNGFAEAAILLAVFLVLWSGGALLLAVIGAWRAAAWTVDAAGTFGAVATGRPGDWKGDVDSATLTDLRPPGVDPDPR